MQLVAIFTIIAGLIGAAIAHEDAVPSLYLLSDHHKEMSERAGYSYVDKLEQLEEDLLSRGQYVTKDSPLYRMAQFKRPSPEARELSVKATRMLEATRYLKSQMGLSHEESGIGISRAISSFSVINNTCLPTTTCPSTSKYRAIDGSCNSLTITNLGKSNTDYRRVIAPNYADGIQIPRLSTNGSALPSARLVSTAVFGAGDRPLVTATLALMQFGQLINHDFESTAQFTFSNGTDISCCSNTGGSLNASELHPACLPISVPTNDPFFNRNKLTKTCMNFVRSIAGPRLNCSLGYADQLNQNTHWLDASTVYGSNSGTQTSVRQFSGGLLKTTKDTVNNRELLPITSTCTTGACFYAGDSRATEQPQLTVMHTIWVREHNRIARKLSSLNPTWSDESIYQEARRIVIAEMQHITYKEFLPTLLDANAITKYNLAPLTTGFFTGYSAVTTGPVSNEFSTAAFRMGHSLVQGSVKLYAENGNLLASSYNMSDTFNNASRIVKDATFFDAVIRGLLTQPSQSVDTNVDDALWNKLFREASQIFGFDVVALNIQRGRDHGLPSYNTYRQLCGFTKLKSFADLAINTATSPGFTNVTIPGITSTYASVDDIDLYVGGFSERPILGANVGPTFTCLIAEHFKQIKYSDRYFYELGGQPHSFSSAQLTEIRKASLARIFCDNSDGTVLSVQPKAFSPVSTTNVKVLCTNTLSIPSVNVTLWKNEKLI